MNQDIESDGANLHRHSAKEDSKKTTKKSPTLTDFEKTMLIHELEVHQIELATQNEELNITKEKLENAVDKYTELYDSAPTGYLSLSSDGKITELNLCAAKMIGRERLFLIGKVFAYYVVGPSLEEYNNFLTKVFKHGTPSSCELSLKTSANDLISAYIVGHLSRSGDHCDLSMIDISERKKADELLQRLLNELTLANKKIELQIEEKKLHENELVKTNKELLQAIRLNDDKNRFISILAHDLRSPFSIMLGYSELLLEQIHELNENEIEKLVREIEGSTRNTFTLLEDLLKWARLQTGKVPYKPMILKFSEICHEVVSLIIPMAESKNITIDQIIPQEIEVFADPDMMRAVLRNLLSNAIKFSKPDSQIKITCEQTDSHFIFSVSDTGVGIGPENLQKLFDIDRDQALPGTFGEKGTGLGLFLCKGFIEKHGGKIWVESVLGRGSIFYFNLPTKSSSFRKIVAPPTPAEPKMELKILITDDNESLRIILGEIVKKYSKEIYFAKNGVESVSVMKEHPDIDLILMDFFMPEMNGCEATKQIRAFNKDVIVFVETADTLSDVKSEFAGADINDFFPKPYNKNYFQQLLLKHFVKGS